SSTTVFGYPDGDTVLLRGLDAQPGALVPIYFQAGDDAGQEVLVPVLNGGLPEYKDLLPVDVVTDK
ncbi:MAG: DNA modification methylase, partial [Mycetocola sp.]